MSKEMRKRNKVIVDTYNREKKKDPSVGYTQIGEHFKLSKWRIRDIIITYSRGG